MEYNKKIKELERGQAGGNLAMISILQEHLRDMSLEDVLKMKGMDLQEAVEELM